MRVEQTLTPGRSAGANGRKCVRAGTGAECFSLGEESETSHAGARTRTAEETRCRLQSGDQQDSRSKGERPLGRRSAAPDRSRSKQEAAISYRATSRAVAVTCCHMKTTLDIDHAMMAELQ